MSDRCSLEVGNRALGVDSDQVNCGGSSMPLFEYSCEACGREFEAFVTSQRTPSCPDCHGERLAKHLSSPGMVGVSAPRSAASPQPSGGCGAGGAGCACRMN